MPRVTEPSLPTHHSWASNVGKHTLAAIHIGVSRGGGVHVLGLHPLPAKIYEAEGKRKKEKNSYKIFIFEN